MRRDSEIGLDPFCFGGDGLVHAVAEGRGLPGENCGDQGREGRELKKDPDSPVPADKKASLIPLAYFPIDESYAVPASLEPSADRSRIQVPTSIGKNRELERIGTLKFSLKGQSLRLTAFHDLESQQVTRLFVPFSDITSGTETSIMATTATTTRTLRGKRQPSAIGASVNRVAQTTAA